MAYDEDRGVTVLFGGRDKTTTIEDLYFNDTWEWNGERWALKAIGPAHARYDGRLSYSAAEKSCVLFAGMSYDDINYSLHYNDTWKWDGLRWQPASPLVAPSRRRGFGMTFDQSRNRIVVQGGYRWDGDLRSNFREHWEFNREQWYPVKVAGGSDFGVEHLEYDEAAKRLVGMSGAFGPEIDDYVYELRQGVYVEEHPEDAREALGAAAEFTARIEAAWPVALRWYRGNEPLSESERVTGTQTQTLRISPVQEDDEGFYSLRVDGGCEAPIYSRRATLDVNPLEARLESDCASSRNGVLRWRGATPEGRVHVYFARTIGSEVIPVGNSCFGTSLGLGNGGLTFAKQSKSNAAGHGAVQAYITSAACGGYVQAVDVENCTVSNVMRVE